MKFLVANRGVSIFIVLSICFVLLIWKYAPNPRVTYDSRAYIEASKSIDVYFHGKNSDGYSYLFRPPIIPLYLHFFQNKILSAKIHNVICFVMSLWLCYFIGREFKFEPIFISLFIVSVGVSYPWLQNHFFVWSEPLFNVLFLSLLWTMIVKSHWLWIAALCVLLYFVRKAGLIIATGIVCGSLMEGENKKAFLVGLVAGLVGVCWEWLIWVYSNGSTTQVIFEDTPLESRLQCLDVMTAWFLPRNISLIVRSIILCTVIALLIARFKENFVELVRDPKIKMVFCIATIYIFVFVVMWRLDYNEAERYLSVVTPLAMLLLTFLQRSINFTLGHGKYMILLTSALWMVYPVARTCYHLLN